MMGNKSIIKIYFVLIIATMLTCLCYAQNKYRILVENNNKFAFALCKTLAEDQSNLIFSPYSISTALSMAYAGAGGITEAQMAKAMRLSLTQIETGPAYRDLRSILNKHKLNRSVKIGLANSMWIESEFHIIPNYINTIKDDFGGKLFTADFSTAKSRKKEVAKINAWVEKKTCHIIKDFLHEKLLTSTTRLILVNAIYFSGLWKFPFDLGNTRSMHFYITEDKTVKVPIMYQKQDFNYTKNRLCRIIELPYLDDKLSMIVILPINNDAMRELLKDLSPTRLKSYLKSMKQREVKVYLPRFEVIKSFSLKKNLISMGMSNAFSAEADFSGITGKKTSIQISDVIHKAFIKVDEKGTEAAAATAAMFRKIATSNEDYTFRANHPFICMIKENKTGSILFMGIISDPTKADE